MIYQGQAIQVHETPEAYARWVFDLSGERINKLNRATIAEMQAALAALKQRTNIRGLILQSAKEAFIVGADITEFHEVFAASEQTLIEMNQSVHELFNQIEDLPYPSVTLINGLALGGGFEICLTTDYRLAAPQAKIGLPETKLGIIPGWGGCVRLPRLIGCDNALEWICGGNEYSAEAALKVGAVDGVVAQESLLDAAYHILAQAHTGTLNWQAKRRQKLAALKLNPIESMMAFESAKGVVAAKAGKHYPAPMQAIKAVQEGAAYAREKAQQVEAKHFAKMAKTPVCHQLVGLFLSDQQVKKTAQKQSQQARPVKKAAVLGAGIMGGGIAYQSAYKKIPIIMKDVHEEALNLGLQEASQLLSKQVARKKLTLEDMATRLSHIRATLSYGDFADVDLVVEAVVENQQVKGRVLAEVESLLSAQAVLTSNTSTISIDALAQHLSRPENFCGMHFFNPVHKMPLVEVIRGQATSDAAVAQVVAYAQRLGKTPIVVKDCPGFLVNRILFPYFAGFMQLLAEGVDFQRIDKVMEKFGWPMGPAYLLDVVGLDTALHAHQVMAAGFPDRMAIEGTSALDIMQQAQRRGQKNQQGFYRYQADKKGRWQKIPDASVYEVLAPLVQSQNEVSDEQIVQRLMIPLCLESVRCLQEGIVASAAEADMALVYGIGFPPFLGGAFRYIDSLGLETFVAQADSYAQYGPLYQVTDEVRAQAAHQQAFYA
ncbi:3-hydroxyacyl-CoA dehydrogenase / enoyl-CoA hydratase / 3-hydroxybutyryl-CoA epimerase / enoyl-CoA isomerase [Allopseudospirillum japonicum]|uniref:enoyl-CoA hydratase n=1 Tax=Allopseudospirillum japonicum TaxID=64971 RepID=A0A1H6QAN3_9GAMM|nr:fatty acid oxidation complex subunit alpha FadB [Allopseudospirillum japonicum]SEI37874.1 3-hydroxyacyl-CoA dehydrogenase / enoyl-CoA hydratase / 3-hydroxybutyryl-CoA epimerase / enoyl-CoA isomerase [Allopseudospirillum japonicum]